MDRLVHAKLVTGVTPTDLAARAANSLALVGADSGPEITTMLEPPGREGD